MDDDQLWTAIDLQRGRTADLLEQLSDEQWARPSLCAGWRIRDVAAHLTLQQVTLGEALLSVLRHPGDLGGLNRMIRRSAQHESVRPVDDLVRDLRATIGSRRHNVGVTPLETLIDILVHGQDIAIPVQVDLPMPVDAAVTAADRIWSYGGKGKARVFDAGWARPFRYQATDVTWSAGAGPDVTGPISAILLLLAGRRAALPQLSGAGADDIRARPATVRA